MTAFMARVIALVRSADLAPVQIPQRDVLRPLVVTGCALALILAKGQFGF